MLFISFKMANLQNNFVLKKNESKTVSITERGILKIYYSF